MKPEPSYEDFLQKWSESYTSKNYDSSFAGYLLGKSHEWSEVEFDANNNFDKVLEVGAGTSVHLNSVRHQFNEYWITDLNLPMLDMISEKHNSDDKKVITQQEDATRLSFPDNSFDRLIAAHVLEHIYRPHEVLREWARVVKPGGVITLVLPCDPGIAWRLGRYISARGKFTRDGIDYDYWMAREHVNAINNLSALVRYYFSSVKEVWRPCYVPSMDINLFYITHITVE
jgi:ubiquinone/menaquinone biosynthesis C-methylase UbiE